MTLTRRALLVILPVVLASNLLVALSVYVVQKRMIEDSETTRFSTRMGRLADAFDGDVDFTRNLVFSMLGGEAVRKFVHEENPEFQIAGLGVRVQDGIKFFSRETSRFVSFAIVGPNDAVDYYFENSDDPFAEIRPEQVALAKRVLAGSDAASDQYVATDDGGLIVHSQLLDRRTFEAPLATQREFAFVIQAAVRPKAFAELKGEIERDYATSVSLTPPGAEARGPHASAVDLLPDLALSSQLPEAYLTGRMGRLKMVLSLGSIAFSLLSVGILVFLIRRTVTGPIARLDREVKEVIDGVREGLEATSGTGEVGRLSQNIKSMHDETLSAFRRVQQMSWTDPLTGIANRQRFDAIGREWMGPPNDAPRVLSLLFIDLDNFKHVNDTFGHASGDAVLKAFSARAGILARAREAAGWPTLLARLAGDEFAILVRAEAAAAVELAAEVVRLFANGWETEGRIYPVSASIGIATAPFHATAFDELICCADAAMYQAKAAGRNGFAVFAPDLSLLARAS